MKIKLKDFLAKQNIIEKELNRKRGLHEPQCRLN